MQQDERALVQRYSRPHKLKKITVAAKLVAGVGVKK